MKCMIRSCSEAAHWHVTTVGHPNGDMNAWYCVGHAKAYPWDESPARYKTVIEGPYSDAATREDCHV